MDCVDCVDCVVDCVVEGVAHEEEIVECTYVPFFPLSLFRINKPIAD